MRNKLLITIALASTSSIALAGNMGVIPTYYSYKVGPYAGVSIGGINNTVSTPASYKGLSGIVSLGIGHLNYQNIYIAGEIWGDTSATIKNFPVAKSRNYSISSSWGYGFDIMPGLVFNERVLTYLRLGVLSRNFNDIQQTRGGLRIGLGGQTNLFKNVDLRAEYVYSQFHGTSLGTPLTDQYNLGVVYKFV
jgi:opacity protein-like surface antigen